MKMAKAETAEWETAMRFVNELEEEIKYPNKTDEELGAWVRKAPCLFRVVAGYQVLVDNCCDPKADCLEWKPEVVAALEAYKKPDAPAESANDPDQRPGESPTS